MSEEEAVVHAELVEHTKKWDERLTLFWKMLILFGVTMIVVVGVFLVYTLTEVQRIGEANNQLNKQTIQISQRLVDCTTPGHACYDSGQKQTGQAVKTLNQVTEAAVICADAPGVITKPEMESCIKAQLGK